MRNKCFIDFDGTIISNKKRLYQFFIQNIPKEFVGTLSEDEFWALKQFGINEIEWLNQHFDANISTTLWNQKKLNLIEDAAYLQYDYMFDYSQEALNGLKERYSLILVTRRENKEGLFRELERFGLSSFFDNVLVLSHSSEKKSTAVSSHYCVSPNDLFIGDTEDDIEAGITLGCKSYFVLSGIRNHWVMDLFSKNDNINVVDNIYSISTSIDFNCIMNEREL